MKIIFITLFLLFGSFLQATNCSETIRLIASEPKNLKIRQIIETRSLKFFLENTHPITGMVRDRANAFENIPKSNTMSSIAATGFGMTIMAHAANNGKMPKAEAEKNIENALEFAFTLEQHKGWLPHFVEWESGKRIEGSEISTIDTGIFISGALYAAEMFPQNKKITNLANQLYERLDFQDMMTNGGSTPTKRTLSMGFDPKTETYIPANWDTYSEHMVLSILGLGHPDPNKRLPLVSWTVWKRQTIETEKGQKIIGADLPLFAHQYPWMWLDPHSVKIDNFDPYQNSRLMTLRDQELSKKDERLAKYGIWGLSASDGPEPEGYRAYRHGDKKEDPGDNTGTVCPGCVAGSVVFAPEVVLPYLSSLMTGPFKTKTFGKYGFVDAFNPSQNWTATDSLAITVGPAYMSSANLENSSIWKDFSKIKSIKAGLKSIGF